MEDPRRLLSLCANQLKPGGLLVLTVPRFDSIVARLFGGRWRALHPAHVWYFSRQSLLNLCADAQLDILETRPYVRDFGLRYLATRLWNEGAHRPPPNHWVPRSQDMIVPITLGDEIELIARRREES